MDYIIRKVKNGDETSLAYIQTESWKAAFKGILSDEDLQKYTEISRATAMYKRLLDDNIGNGYILEVDGTPHCIAYWDKSRDDDMSDYAELICIHSMQGKWRNGFGTKMMDRVLEDIKAAGYRKVMLWVFTENERARRFYEACGYVTNGKVKPCFGTEEMCYERILMEEIKTICGSGCCKDCTRLSECGGCIACNGKPFGGECVAANYINAHGQEAYEELKQTIMSEINSLGIENLIVKDLNLLNGFFVNLEYPFANGSNVKFLVDKNIYLGNQIEQPNSERCYGVVADENMILVCEYGCMGKNPVLLRYIKR